MFKTEILLSVHISVSVTPVLYQATNSAYYFSITIV